MSILSKKKLSIMSILSGIHNEYQILERQWHLQINMTGLQAHMKILRTNPQEKIKKNKKTKQNNVLETEMSRDSLRTPRD